MKNGGTTLVIETEVSFWYFLASVWKFDFGATSLDLKTPALSCVLCRLMRASP